MRPIGVSAPHGATSVTLTIDASANDGQTNVFANNGASVAPGYNFNKRGVWLRFTTGLPNLAGKTITSAILRIDTVVGQSTGSHTTVRANKVAAAVNPTDDADFAAKALTTASVAWVSVDPGGDLVLQDSPDLSTVIQELVDTYGGTLTAIMLMHLPPNADESKSFHYYTVDSVNPPSQLLLTYV